MVLAKGLKNNSGFKKLKQIVYDDIFWIQLQAFDAILKPFVFVQASSEMKHVSSGMILLGWNSRKIKIPISAHTGRPHGMGRAV